MKNMKFKGSVIGVILALSGCGTDDVSDIQHYEKAEKYYDAEDYRSSLIELKNALKKNSDLYDARVLLGGVYLSVGEGVAAEKEFRHALRIGKGTPFLEYKIAMALYQQRKFEEIIALDEVLTKKGTESSLLALNHALLAVVYLKKNDINTARTHVDSALLLDRGLVEVQLANIKTMTAEGRYENARSVMGDLLASHGEESSVWYLHANMLFSRGEFEKAATGFAKVIQIEPKTPLTRRAFKSKISLARTYILDKTFDKAKIATDELLKLKSKHPAVLYLGASLAYYNNDLDSALTSLLEVVERAPHYYPAVLLLGATHFGQKNYEQANVELSRYLTQYPENIAARKLLAATELKLNKPKNVIEMLTPLINTAENDSELLMMVGRASIQVGDIESALEYISKAKLIEGNVPRISAELARAYFSQGDYQSVIDELDTIEGEGENRAKIAMVMVHIKNNDIANARNLAKSLISKSVDKTEYLILAGAVELAAGEALIARGYFEDAVILTPASIAAHTNIAYLDMRSEKFGAAKKGFEKVLEIDPGNTKVMFAMAQLAEQRGDIESGTKWLEKIRSTDSGALLPRLSLARYYLHSGKTNKALEIAEEAKSENISEPALLFLLSKIYKVMGNFDNALIINSQLVELMPTVPGAYLELSETQIALKKYEPAKVSLKKAIALKPDYMKAKVLLATVNIYLDDYKSALQLAREMKKEFPEASLGYRLSGIALSKMGKQEEAEPEFLKALTLRKTSELTQLLARNYIDRKQFSKAEELMLSYLNTERKDTAIIFQLASLYQKKENLSKARRYYLQILDSEPENIRALNDLAMLLLNSGDFTQALPYAKQAYRKKSSDVFIKDTYGWALVLAGQLKEGLELIEDSAIRTGHPSVQYHYAYALNKQGDVAKAKQILGKILNNPENFLELKEAKKLFSELGAK